MNLLPKADKRKAFEHLLSVHHSIYIHVDTRRDGVVLPKALLNRPQVALQIGLHLRPTPVAGLDIDNSGWKATLSFNQTPFLCTIPWSAVYFIVSETGIGYHWPDATPPEVTVQRADENEKASEKTSARSRMPKGWAVLDGGKTVPTDSGPNPPIYPPSPNKAS